ncbi:TPA: helix-turn-helix transcriptional regulator, partial [Klebsiella pneumoniae]
FIEQNSSIFFTEDPFFINYFYYLIIALIKKCLMPPKTPICTSIPLFTPFPEHTQGLTDIVHQFCKCISHLASSVWFPFFYADTIRDVMANFESSQRHPTGEVKMSNVSAQKTHSLRILRMTELTAILGISRSSIYEKLNPKSRYYDAEFPKPVRLGAASVGWRSTAIDEWIASRTV